MVSSASRSQRDSANGAIISQSLDALNGSSSGNKAPVGISNNADYAFQTNVMNAAYSDKGAFVDIRV
jgi:hypothetical protein